MKSKHLMQELLFRFNIHTTATFWHKSDDKENMRPAEVEDRWQKVSNSMYFKSYNGGTPYG